MQNVKLESLLKNINISDYSYSEAITKKELELKAKQDYIPNENEIIDEDKK